MTKEEETNLIELENVLLECISYVGRANYRERENHANQVAQLAFEDFRKGRTPIWRGFEDVDCGEE